MQALSLRQRIEMRINRVPKKAWKMTMGALLAQSEGRDAAIAAPVRKLVQDVQKLRYECCHCTPADSWTGHSCYISEPQEQKASVLAAKKRIEKKFSATAPSARERMPPPPVPQPSYMSPTKTSKQLPPNSSSPGPPDRAASPVKRVVKSSRTRAPVSKATRPISRATARTSIETAGTGVASGNEGGYTSAASRGTKASQAKAKAAAEALANGLKRGGVKGAGSNGSLKENKVAGVKEPAVKKTATGRVLRSRK